MTFWVEGMGVGREGFADGISIFGSLSESWGTGDEYCSSGILASGDGAAGVIRDVAQPHAIPTAAVNKKKRTNEGVIIARRVKKKSEWLRSFCERKCILT